MPNDVDSWLEWGKHILKELERLNKEQINTRDQLNDLKIEIKSVVSKISTIGAVAGGSIPIVVFAATILISPVFKICSGKHSH